MANQLETTFRGSYTPVWELGEVTCRFKSLLLGLFLWDALKVIYKAPITPVVRHEMPVLNSGTEVLLEAERSDYQNRLELSREVVCP